MICYGVSIAVLRPVPNRTPHHQTDLQIQNLQENPQGMMYCDDELLRRYPCRYYSPWIDPKTPNSYHFEKNLLLVVVVVLVLTMVVKDNLVDVHTDSLHRVVVKFDQHNIHQEKNAPTVDTAPPPPKEMDTPVVMP